MARNAPTHGAPTIKRPPKGAKQGEWTCAEEVIEDFQSWMCTLSGGYVDYEGLTDEARRKNWRSVKDHKAKMYTILLLMFGHNYFTHESLLNLKYMAGDNECEGLLWKLKKGEGHTGRGPLTWGTVCNHMNSVLKFLTYIRLKEEYRKTWATQQAIEQMFNQYQACRDTCERMKTIDAHTRAESKMTEVYSADTLKAFILSEQLLVGTVAWLANVPFEPGDDIEANLMAAARIEEAQRNLLLWLVLESGKRTGVFGVMTVDDITKAVNLKEIQKHIVSVKSHKTQHSLGSARLVLDYDQYKAVIDLISHMKHLMPLNKRTGKVEGPLPDDNEFHIWGELTQFTQKGL